MNKILFYTIVVAVAVGGASFYGGMKYGESSSKNSARQNFAGQANAGGFRGGRTGGQAGGGFVSGEVIAKDDKTVTLKLRDGGSKIIFYSETTEIGKFVNGGTGDLEVGKSVTVNGKANTDGSITAESIQLRLDRLIAPQR